MNNVFKDMEEMMKQILIVTEENNRLRKVLENINRCEKCKERGGAFLYLYGYSVFLCASCHRTISRKALKHHAFGLIKLGAFPDRPLQPRDVEARVEADIKLYEYLQAWLEGEDEAGE